MWIAIIPAYNEAKHIQTVLQNLIPCNFKLVILVANGCNDQTEEYALQASKKLNLEILSFPEPLGLDIPRAIGAAHAKKYHPQGIVFIDGDMNGKITPSVFSLLQGLKKGLDLALTNCYPSPCYPSPSQLSDLAANVLKFREIVNKKLGVFPKIGCASPSHGPHALSARLLSQIPIKALAIPPLTLAYASQNHLQVGVAASISHKLLGSPQRSPEHAQNIADTIIGDCLQTLAYLEGASLDEILQSQSPPSSDSYSVYRKARRFDVLESFLTPLPTTS